MRKPDAYKKADALNREQERWITQVVRPYLLDLLNKSQARLRKRIVYEQNQMFDHLHIGSTDLLLCSEREKRLIHRYLPDLYAFMEMLKELTNVWDNPWVGDIEPTVSPRA